MMQINENISSILWIIKYFHFEFWYIVKLKDSLVEEIYFDVDNDWTDTSIGANKNANQENIIYL